MTSDHYTILGVTPTAETVVIGAAYRALMRHYHPDTNSDPAAQVKAREITAAYNVLRDPEKRAAYDRERTEDDALWEAEETPRRPPPMRAVGIGALLLAVGLVVAVWQYAPPASSPPVHPAPTSPKPAADAEPDIGAPIAPLRPEGERLSEINRTASPPPAAPVVDAPDPVVADPTPPGPTIVPALRHMMARPTVAPPRPRRSPPPLVARANPAPPPPPPPRPTALPKSERVATLDRMSSGFFTQSMNYADGARKRLLAAARAKGDSERKACRSDACVADAYVRQIRATSAIMAGKAAPPK